MLCFVQSDDFRTASENSGQLHSEVDRIRSRVDEVNDPGLTRRVWRHQLQQLLGEVGRFLMLVHGGDVTELLHLLDRCFDDLGVAVPD